LKAESGVEMLRPVRIITSARVGVIGP
jgi:hypothetical protein